uniref:Nucleoside phosphorylase domain-containing protein n=1 Tax=Amphimedon queenslandica TaxID=400682 RepID=A0A1X7UCH5_AMPQE
PPEWLYHDEIVGCVPETPDFHEDLVKDIEILLMPAIEKEEEPVVYYLKQSSKKFIETYIDGLRVYIGNYGKSKVVVVMTALDKSRQGPIHANAITSKMLEKVPSIKYVVAVGVCFGMDPKKQNLGDVIISGTICDFTNKREGLGENEYQRGPQHQVKPAITHKFRPPHGFKMPHNITVSTGVLISTCSLIDNPDIKKKLLDQKPDAIAGEMEGAGIMAAIDYAPEHGVSAIVIKGIGDWGDGDKKSIH